MIDGDRGTTTTRYEVTVGERVLTVELIDDAGGVAVRIGDGEAVPASVRRPSGDELLAAVVGRRTISALVHGSEEAYGVVLDGQTFDVQVRDERAARLAGAVAANRPASAETTVKAPMPGLVVRVNVEPGQAVAKGTSLVVLQAMKMENELTARADATIKDVQVSSGQTVDQGQTLITLE